MLNYPKPLRYLNPFPTEALHEVREIKWLSRIGLDNTIEEWLHLPDREKAVVLANSDEWADFRLEMRNEMTGFLASRHSQNYTEWNNTAKALRGFYENEIEPDVLTALQQKSLPLSLSTNIAWDVVSALQEIAFAQFRIPRFYDRLLAVYRRGHLPCFVEPLDLQQPSGSGKIVIY